MSDTKKTEEVKDGVKDIKKTSETAKKNDAEKKTASKSTAATKTAETKKAETKKTDTAKKAEAAKKDDKADKTEDKAEQQSNGDKETANSEVKDVDVSTQESDMEQQKDTAPASDPEKWASDKADDTFETHNHEDNNDEADVETDDKSSEDKLQIRTVRFRGFTPVYMHPSKKSASASVQGIVYVSSKTIGGFAEILAAIPGLGKTKCYVEKQRVGVK